MSRRSRAARLALLAALAALWLMLSVSVQGCTVLGLVIGVNADTQSGTGGPGKIFQVDPGTSVTLDLLDGSAVTGRFLGWTRDSASAAIADSLPLRGVQVRIALGDGERLVPAENIERVRVPKFAGTVIGLLVGIGLDVLVVQALKDSANSRPTGCSDTSVLQGFSDRDPGDLGRGGPSLAGGRSPAGPGLQAAHLTTGSRTLRFPPANRSRAK